MISLAQGFLRVGGVIGVLRLGLGKVHVSRYRTFTTINASLPPSNESFSPTAPPMVIAF